MTAISTLHAFEFVGRINEELNGKEAVALIGRHGMKKLFSSLLRTHIWVTRVEANPQGT